MTSVMDRLRRRRQHALVLSGGGNLGAIQVGMLKALAERDLRPSYILGCSVGALNGVAFAADPTPEGVARLERAWIGLEDDLLMPSGWIPASVQLARKGEALHSNENLQALIESVVEPRRFGELQIPFECVATRVHDAAEIWFSEGQLIDAVLASAALPAVYPAVDVDGARHIDGGVVNDVPVSRAVELGFRHIFILHVGNFDRPRPEPRRPLDVLIQSYWIARRHRFHRDLDSIPDTTKLHILPIGDHPEIRYNDFSRSEQLIQQAYAATIARLDAAGPEGLWSPAHSRPSFSEPSGDPPALDPETEAELEAELEDAIAHGEETPAEHWLRRFLDRSTDSVRRLRRKTPDAVSEPSS